MDAVKISIESKQLQDALSIGGRFIKSTDFTRIYVKEFIILQQYSDNGDLFEYMLSGKIINKGDITVSTEILSGIAKGRNTNLVLSADKALSFAKKEINLSGSEIPLGPKFENSILMLKDIKNDIKIPAKVQNKILTLLPICSLNSFLSDKDLSVFVKSIDDKIYIGCADVIMSSLGIINESSKEIDITIPSSYAKMLKEIKGDGLSIKIGKNVTIRTDKMNVVLASLQTEDIVHLTKIIELSKEKPKSKIKLNAEQLKSALDSITIAIDEDTPVKIKVKHNVAYLYYKTNKGMCETNFPVSGLDTEININLVALKSRLGYMAGEITILVYGHWISINYDMGEKMNLCFMCSCQ